MTKEPRKPKFHVGQLVVDKYGRLTKIRAIDPDGTLYERVGFGTPLLTKISDVRPLTKRERGGR